MSVSDGDFAVPWEMLTFSEALGVGGEGVSTSRYWNWDRTLGVALLPLGRREEGCGLVGGVTGETMLCSIFVSYCVLVF
jgi:hypothetical protein